MGKKSGQREDEGGSFRYFWGVGCGSYGGCPGNSWKWMRGRGVESQSESPEEKCWLKPWEPRKDWREREGGGPIAPHGDLVWYRAEEEEGDQRKTEQGGNVRGGANVRADWGVPPKIASEGRSVHLITRRLLNTLEVTGQVAGGSWSYVVKNQGSPQTIAPADNLPGGPTISSSSPNLFLLLLLLFSFSPFPKCLFSSRELVLLEVVISRDRSIFKS